MNGWYKYPLLILSGVIIGWALFHSCEPDPAQVVIDKSDSLKGVIADLKAQYKGGKIEAIHKDSIRTVTVTKWRTVRHDSLIPCPFKLALCDTVIMRDSSLISTLTGIISTGDSIIYAQGQLIKNDSLVIAGLKGEVKTARKEVRRQKFQKWAAVVAGIGVVAILLR